MHTNFIKKITFLETDNAAVYRGPSTKIHRNFALFPFLQTSPQGRNRESSKLYMRKEGSEVSDGMTMPISQYST